MKRIVLLFVVCAVLLSGIVSGQAYNYPSEFWNLNKLYDNAVKAGNHSQIIQYGNKIINLILTTVDSYEKTDILVTRYDKVAKSYAYLGDYQKSLVSYEKLCSYADGIDEYYDYTRNARARIEQYRSVVEMYTGGGQSPYYGAVNEKGNGVLFGLCSNGATRSMLSNESMVLTYQELGQTLIPYNAGVMKDASSKGLAVEFALNCPKEGEDIRNIRRMDKYLKEISDLFKKYPKVPVYLRFAAEFDTWDVLAEPEEFKEAFRYVSDYFTQRHDNVAMVWSPNQASNWYVNRDDFYPGDKYVDWVGVSLYAQKYFPHQQNAEVNEVVFKTGINSDPVISVRDIVEKYGDRKPIMISECGCGHKMVKSGEDTSQFARERLRQYLSYLPMVYPQIKMIAYFDWYVNAESEKSDYRLSTNSSLRNEYLELISGKRFIQNGYNGQTDFCYRKVYNGMSTDSVFELSCYAHLYGANLKRVTYYIDDKFAAYSEQVPYEVLIDASEYLGTRKLKAVAEFDNGETLVTTSDVYINKPEDDITVKINEKKLDFDQQPILYNNRTMVPMRKIFEELGAKVKWDGTTGTVTGTKGDRIVKVSVGSKIMTVNNKTLTLDTAPIILSGRTLVPVRAVAEGLGCSVDWNGKSYTVAITPKVFKWSEWSTSLPSSVDKDMYYIEEREEYRVRTRDEEYFTLDYKIGSSNYLSSQTKYGSWSDWTDSIVLESSNVQVETRTVYSQKEYLFGHYCTGNESDESIRYKTRDYDFSDKCIYHSLGWYDRLLPMADDGVGYIAYKDNGNKLRCSNTCYRWYIMDEKGGNRTQYRYRKVKTEYKYWQWGDWSEWSSWKTGDPYKKYSRSDRSVDIDQRTVYRYKEKG